MSQLNKRWGRRFWTVKERPNKRTLIQVSDEIQIQNEAKTLRNALLLVRQKMNIELNTIKNRL